MKHWLKVNVNKGKMQIRQPVSPDYHDSFGTIFDESGKIIDESHLGHETKIGLPKGWASLF